MQAKAMFLAGKLMQSNRLQVCNRFKLDLNWILIYIYDPIPAVRFTRCDNSIRIRIQISILDLILYQKSSVLSKIGKICSKIVVFGCRF